MLEGGGNLSGVRADSWSLNIRVSGREWFCLGLELTTDGYTISGDIWPRTLIRLDQTLSSMGQRNLAWPHVSMNVSLQYVSAL